MKENEAKTILKETLQALEKVGVTYHSLTTVEERRGGQKYIEMKVTIKVE